MRFDIAGVGPAPDRPAHRRPARAAAGAAWRCRARAGCDCRYRAVRRNTGIRVPSAHRTSSSTPTPRHHAHRAGQPRKSHHRKSGSLSKPDAMPGQDHAVAGLAPSPPRPSHQPPVSKFSSSRPAPHKNRVEGDQKISSSHRFGEKAQHARSKADRSERQPVARQRRLALQGADRIVQLLRDRFCRATLTNRPGSESGSRDSRRPTSAPPRLAAESDHVEIRGRTVAEPCSRTAHAPGRAASSLCGSAARRYDAARSRYRRGD